MLKASLKFGTDLCVSSSSLYQVHTCLPSRDAHLSTLLVDFAMQFFIHALLCLPSIFKAGSYPCICFLHPLLSNLSVHARPHTSFSKRLTCSPIPPVRYTRLVIAEALRLYPQPPLLIRRSLKAEHFPGRYIRCSSESEVQLAASALLVSGSGLKNILR